MKSDVNTIVILGGDIGSYTLAHRLKTIFSDSLSVSLIDQNADEFDDCVTLPPASISFFKAQGIGDDVLINLTNGLYRSAVLFKNKGRDFFLPFSSSGFMLRAREFQHFYVWAKKQGLPNGYDEFSLSSMSARKLKFLPASGDAGSLLSTLSYGYTLSTEKLKRVIRSRFIEGGGRVIDGRFISAKKDKDGRIAALEVQGESGATVNGDFFIDFSGGENDLLASAYGVPYKSEHAALPVGSCLRLTFTLNQNAVPYSSIETLNHGWKLEKSTQNKKQVDYLHAEASVSDEALEAFCKDAGVALGDVKFFSAPSNRRNRFWVNNCIAMGRSSGYLQDFSMSAYALSQSAISRFIDLFPVSKDVSYLADEYNRLTHLEYDHVVDFHSLHYRLFQNAEASHLENYSGNDISERLKNRVELFKNTGRIPFYEGDPFSQDVWVSSMLGGGIIPKSYDVLIDGIDPKWIAEQMKKMFLMVDGASSKMPTLQEYLKQGQVNGS